VGVLLLVEVAVADLPYLEGAEVLKIFCQVVLN
jgi:hypothetical protein